MTKNIIEVKCLKHKYPDNTEVSACGLDFLVKKGEKVALVGLNGSGKTTLILHILGVLKPTEGTILVLKEDPHKDFDKISHKIGVVFQSVEDQLIGPTVLDDVLFSALNYNFEKKEAIKKGEEVMEDLGINHLKDKVIHYLSGGEKKRVALAGALIINPEILVLDEAFNQIDPKGLKRAVSLIDKHSKRGMATVMAVSNEEDLEYFEKVFFLEKGKIVFGGSKDDFIKNHKARFCSH